MSTRHADVVILAPEGDCHGMAVQRYLISRGVSALLIGADNLLRHRVSWSPAGQLVIGCANGEHVLDDATTVWYRKRNEARPSIPDGLEKRLVKDEIDAMQLGLLEAAGVRWVDEPWVAQRCSLKPVQLNCATKLGLQIPSSIVTNDPQGAIAFASGAQLVAKAISSGAGIAPYVDVVPQSQFDLLSTCPTFLQRLVEAESDARVVTVGDNVFSWIRSRSPLDPPDWRAVDPRGYGFKFSNTDVSRGGAEKLASSLGLSFTVQDWLIGRDDVVFLEVNTQGQWLFLAKAQTVLVPAIGEMLVAA